MNSQAWGVADKKSVKFEGDIGFEWCPIGGEADESREKAGNCELISESHYCVIPENLFHVPDVSPHTLMFPG